MGKEQALVFGEVAHDYDRVRPSYPDRLIDDVLEFAGLEPGGPLLDVGAGTGRATLAFAARGAVVTALEPDPAMAAVLRAKLPAGSGAVEAASLERFDRVENHFGLVTSAQSWHWTDPSTRYDKAAAVLRPGGALAIFWNRDWLADPAVARDHLAVHREIAPHLNAGLGPVTERAYPDRPDLAAHPAFTAVERRVYHWTRRLRRADCLTLLGTHSEYRMLDDATRDRLFAALAPVLPDEVDFDGGTVLFLARKSAG
jgi:SAM-dependent methyltransferase